MDIKHFVTNFDFKNPDWSNLPDGFPKCDLKGLSSAEVGKFGAIQMTWELSRPKKPKSRSRVWQSPNGYIYLVPWANAGLLRVLGNKWWYWFREGQVKGYYRNLKEAEAGAANSFKVPLKSSNEGYRSLEDVRGTSPPPPSMAPQMLGRTEGQILDALRSNVANIEEGYARPTTKEYLQFLGYSEASLKEVKGDIQRLYQGGWLRTVPGSGLADLRIDLKQWHEALKQVVVSKPVGKILQNPLKSSKEVYRKLEDFRGGSRPGRNKSPNEPYRSLEDFRGKTSAFTPYRRKKDRGYSTFLDIPASSFSYHYPPVDNFRPEQLTYEILIELVNKTDWHLRRLVEGLENKRGRKLR